jgi:tetratricopeptide (TPR) repeat protein
MMAIGFDLKNDGNVLFEAAHLERSTSMIQTMFAVALVCLLSFGISSAQDSAQELESSLAKNPNDVKILSRLGTVYYYRAAAGDEQAVEKGIVCFDKCLTLDSSDAVSRVYRGSLWTMRGRDASSMEDADKGIVEMDRAVTMAPRNLTVRLVRGINSTVLPSPFNRLEIAFEDFNYLLGLPEFPHFNAELQSTIYCWAGIAYRNDNKMDKAKELLKQAITVAPHSESGKRAEQELKEMK